MQRLHQLQGVPGPVEEIRVAEGDVPGAGGHLLRHVRQHDLHRDHEEAPRIGRRQRTVQAVMLAAPRGLHVAHGAFLACGRGAGLRPRHRQRELGVGAQCGQAIAGRQRKLRARKPGGAAPGACGEARGGWGGPRGQGRGQRHQGRLALAAEDAVRRAAQQELRVQGRIEPVEADVGRGIERPHPLGDAQPDAQRGVHGHADAHQRRAPHGGGVESGHGQVLQGGRVPGFPQKAGGRGQPHGLMPQLVAGEQQDAARGRQGYGVGGHGRGVGAGYFLPAW